MSKAAASTLVNARCYPSHVVRMLEELKPLMSDRHLELFGETPFGHLLELPAIVQERGLLDELLYNYDEKTNTFKIRGSNLAFRSEDVALILGLSCKGRALKTERKDFNKEQLNAPFVKQYFDKGHDRNKDRMAKELIRLVKEDPASELDFVQLLVGYIVGTFLLPTTSSAAPWWVGCYASNLEELGEFAWASMVHHWLMEDIPKAAAKVKDRRSRNEATSGYVKGCVIVLNVW